jgi:cytochrome b
MTVTVRVWDAPTRLFHWALVVCFVCLVVTAQVGGAAMDWHFRFGYGVLALLFFRLVWGLAGGYWSRFSSFLYSPGQIIRYMKGQGDADYAVGHNPMGAMSVFALLGFLTLQVGSGLFSDDEIAAAGPLTRFVSSTWVANATFYHKEVGKVVLLALVALHLLAIGFYFFTKHENLVRAMITGDKTLDFAAQSANDQTSDRLKALLIITVCAVVVSGLVIWIG